MENIIASPQFAELSRLHGAAREGGEGSADWSRFASAMADRFPELEYAVKEMHALLERIHASISDFGIGRILVERQRQIEVEGYGTDHDIQLNGDVRLAKAADCYFKCPGSDASMPETWPMDVEAWKPKDRMRNLERAGALFLAAAECAERSGSPTDAYRAGVYRVAVEIDIIMMTMNH